MKRTVEIEDTLQESVDAAIEELKKLLEEYFEDNPDKEETPCLFNDLDSSGSFHEIVDSNVPIYTKTITDTWYLYAFELEEAYRNAGIGKDSRENNGMTAIYCYISEKCEAWYRRNAPEIFEEWQKSKQTEGTNDESNPTGEA